MRYIETRGPLVAGVLAVTVTIAGCRAASGAARGSAAESADSVAAPRVDGQRLTLAAGDPQLSSLTASPVVESQSATVTLNGRLAWDEDVTVRVFSPFGGRVDRVLGAVGQHVGPRDVLAVIAAPDFGQAQADAHRAATDLDLAQRTLARQRDLLQHGIVAQREVEEAEADVARARAEQQRAGLRLSAYDADTGSVNQVFPLRAPLGGIIVERNITPGQEVRPDQMLANAPQLFAPLFVVTNPARLWVVLDAPEQDVPFVHAGQPLAIRAKAWPERVFHGTATLVGAALDPETRTLKIRGVVNNPDGALKAEMLVSVDASRAPLGPVAVPSSAVLLEGNAHVVFVEEKRGQYVRREVQVGPAAGGMVPIRAGLRAGERVVTTSTLLLEQLFQTTAHS